MERVISERIKRVRHLLDTVHHIAMATVNKDGSPHSTPLAFFYDKGLNFIY